MWPWDWVIAAGSAISGVSQAVYNWVTQLVTTMMSWVTDAINSIWNTIKSIWDGIHNVWDQVSRYAEELVNGVYRFISSSVSDIMNYVGRLIDDVWHYAQSVYEWVVRSLSDLENRLLSYVNRVYNWVRTEIWDPLNRLYNGIRDWATQWIGRIWQYIEHPELLVNLIGAFMLRMWMQYVIRFAAVFTRWLIRSMASMAGEVFDLLEHVISSII